ncbi:MAG TPA: hypothetical protein VGF08_12145 [Terriglobales bacterium]
MARCGVARIDALLEGVPGTPAIAAGDPDRDAVGVLQDLLTGHAQPGLPGLLSADYGIFGRRTTAAVQEYRRQHDLPRNDAADGNLLQSMIGSEAVDPVCCRAYLTLVLDIPYTGLAKTLAVVAQMEGAGKFTALNLNTDRQGLSYGIIQWAQKPGRLAELLHSFCDASATEFVRTFAAGDAKLAPALLAHVSGPQGGVEKKSGETSDPRFDLVRSPWVERFSQAGRLKLFQQVQVKTALQAFGKSLSRIRRFAPDLRSERGVAFMLDLANQFGDAGAEKIHRAVLQSAGNESDLLSAMAKESVRRMKDQFRDATQARRGQFMTANFLSDGPFGETALSAARDA